MIFDFLVETYRTERLKVLSVWSMFRDDDLEFRPHPQDRRGRSVLEHMVHQCQGEDYWFKNMLGIAVVDSPLPRRETRLEFIRRYLEDSGARVQRLEETNAEWWERKVAFFTTERSRAWIMVRRIAHTAHHRGQQTTLLRMLGRRLYSTYGPSADTGGLPANGALTVYPYATQEELMEGEILGGRKAPLPGPGEIAPSERP